ncbi:telomerase RNA component interacting RNase [Patella vulgata]|uniref:telomerase RNA component interacting RNase n=1 Tax=Patella vulgata TaxID=6465 RepID=UPI00217FAE16|nr:telomerase RNA component interacting RNase [Patella vulgata]
MTTPNKFANDGSFMEMFRRKMAEKEDKTNNASSDSKTKTETTAKTAGEDSSETSVRGGKRTAENEPDTSTGTTGSTSYFPIVGKRRGPKILKTGMVAKKVKEEEPEDDSKKDAWSKYLDEVRKYKSQKCIEDEGGTPLVK